MLKTLRKKGVAKRILWALAIVIIISFGVFGTANYLNYQQDTVTYAGKIFRKKISFSQFETSLQHARHQAILRYGDNFYKISQFLNLESEAWDRLILLHEAKKRKIKVSDEEVVKTIQEFEFFKRNGKFDSKIYEDILRYVFRTQPRDFEEGVRESLVFAKLYEQETSKIQVPEAEMKEEYKKRNEKVQVSYLLFSPQDYNSEVAIEPEESQMYYEDNEEDFRLPSMVNVEYIHLPFPPNAQENQKAEILTQIQTIFHALQKDADFKKVAEHHHLAVNESGFFSREQPNLKIGWSFEVLQKIFEMTPHQVSEPIEAPNGYYIVKIKELKESYIPEYPEAQEKVREALTLIKAKDVAQRKAADYLVQIKENFKNNPQANFAEIGKAFGLNLQKTPTFGRNQYLPTLGIAKDFEEAAFLLNEQNKISEVVETPKGYCILHFDEFFPIDEKKFEEEKADFGEALNAEKKNNFFGRYLAHLRSQAELQSNISKLSQPIPVY